MPAASTTRVTPMPARRSCPPGARWERPGLVFLLLGAALGLAVSVRGAEPFDYFRNSWSLVGLKDYRAGVRITPDNRLQLGQGREARIGLGTAMAPLGRKHTKTLLDGWLPVVQMQAQAEGVRYDLTLWATPLPTVKDWQRAFDWPTEGDNFLCWILARATNPGTQVAAARVTVTGADLGAQPAEALTGSLAPGAVAEGIAWIPFTLAGAEACPAPTLPDARLWLERTVIYWRDRLARAARVEVPCAKATETLKAAHVCQLITNDLGEVHGGEGFYDEFYIRDGAYQVMQLEEAGFAEEARRAIAVYLTRQRPDGRFESQAGQFDANGQAVWALWQYYQITGERAWLESVYPALRQAVDWTAQARRAVPAGAPLAGVLPAAVADGENLWDGKHHIVGYDLWNLRGMLCAAAAAGVLGKDAERVDLLGEAAAYREAIDAAWKACGLAYFPPSWETVGTHWGNTETLWPTPLFADDDARVGALLDEVRHRFAGGFLEGTLRWGQDGAIHPYLSAYTTMASLARGEDAQAVEDFYWYLLHSSATHAFPEGIFYQRRYAWSETIPHGTGASNYAILLRHLLVHEQGEELHLLPAVPDGWLVDGQEIRVERAPTHFGTMTMVVRGSAGGVSVTLDPPTRRPPARVVLHLPRSRPLAAPLPGVTVALRPDQPQRWDWPTVVKLYEDRYMPRLKPIPGLVALPLPEAPTGAPWHSLDLAPLANTDPYTAPFGVPNPGQYLFTGLKSGEQTVAGVPFRILDPAANQGRGIVVLHSPRAPQDREWPKEVAIPVKQSGKRVFFLGNVHGWSANDAGTGDWGAVAEYAIGYADGEVQTVPLITGRTCDDWAAAPSADEVLVGLTGTPWHLHVLGVELQPKSVDRIVFRSLGAQAAAVLVAVTLEP